MFIKSIVLDGFKSYGNRVEITGFDPEFNAITGLNGTGKSNILDSICFVLGITNLSNVRASSLQELIYKHGQAGITKATVSITFDNSNKSQSPIGYESHREITVTRQVVMGGKNKYLINGINVQNKRVNDLFCSIQLNVNNPHFLIMQGRITKVLNMKPPEILSMVEEAAGTRMYESKKQAAQKTIEKKDAKLRELNDIIKEDIAPKLQKLQDERSQFQEYQKVVRELENLTRLYVAWRYVSAEESCKEAEGKVTEVKEQIEDKKNQIKGNEKETKQLEKQVAELNKKLDEESGSILKTLETELQTIEKTEASATSALRAAREALLTHEKRGRLLEKALRDDEAARSNKSSVLDKASATFSSLKAASEASEAALSAAQSRFLAVSSGLEGDDSLQDRLMAAKQEASEASTIIAQSSMEKKHVEESLKSLQKTFSSSASQYARDQESIGRQQAEVDRLQTELASLDFSEERHTSLKEACRGLQQAARAKRDSVDRQAARAQRCNFRYSDPEPGFDRRRIPGILCRQFEVKDSTYTMALETVARGSLYNVIVDTDVTGQLLLERGQLQSRVTCIPLNKIQAHVIDQRTLRTARDIGGGPENVQLALDLITYDQRLHKALAFVFGQTLVCRDVETAKLLAYDRRVAKRCVTWDGDVFNPGGNISGGARPKGEPVLVQLAELRRLENELQAAEQQLQQSSAELTRLQATADTYHQKRQRFETMSYELEGTKARLLNTSHAQTHHEIESLQEKLAELNRRTEENRTRQKEAAARAKELEVKVKDIKGHREREYKKAEEDLKKAKQQAEKDNASWKNREQEFETLRLELQELETAVQTSREQLEQTSFAAVELKDQLDVASREHDAAANAVKQQQSRIKKQKAEIAHRSSDIGRLQQQQEALQQSSNQLQLDIKQLEYSITALQTEAADAEKRIKSLESEHPWIQSERQYFGAAGGLYDFQAKQAHVAGQRLSQLKERKDKLARGLNARAHTLLGKEEEQYQDVMRKKEIVEADRAKLVQVMTELDAKKQRTLITACEQVNKDFASIFSTLLPGACAKLQPPGGLSVLDGLEVKVGFNNTWKESLGELSGGQRSLVALSLVLAMLLFKPAPLYILDEVDAALDLSHTQNIGQMLKAHFTSSQFIIVSLKDGMFNNANVLFRTRFVDGMSAVQRTVNSRT